MMGYPTNSIYLFNNI